jgi:hypothetical protein
LEEVRLTADATCPSGFRELALIVVARRVSD